MLLLLLPTMLLASTVCCCCRGPDAGLVYRADVHMRRLLPLAAAHVSID